MRRPLEIGIDMDDTICHLKPYWIDQINKRYGTNVNHEDITQWDMMRFFPDLTAQDVYGFLEEPGFFRNLEPMPYAQTSIDAMIEEGINVSILTTCSYGHRDKIDWLKNNLKSFSQIDFYTCNRNKYRVNFDMFIDDHVGNLEPYKKHNPDSIVICMNQSHNQHYKGMAVADWLTLGGMIFVLNEKWQKSESHILNPKELWGAFPNEQV